ncbi:MAG TPA: CHAT domain-containing protein [Acetobacteraceae bacterium]|nr:CHAT domain-containing protein [Acetobacteraceae bacterium]
MSDIEPAVTIRIRPKDSEKAFVFQGVGNRTVGVGSKTTFEQAIFEQASLRTMLEEVKAIGGGALDLSLVQADQALLKLYEAGKLVYNGLLGTDVLEYAAEVRELVQESLDAAGSDGRIPWVHVTTADNDPIAHAIPFELIPFRARRPPPSVAGNESRLAEALDGFLGFTTIVRRDCANIFHGGMIVRRPAGVPIKLFQNLSLKNAPAEMEYFCRRPAFDVDGPWPVAPLTPQAFADTLLRQIFDPRARLNGEARDAPDQIHHFACHCDTFGEAVSHRFTLQGPDGAKLSMPLSSLRLKLVERSENRELVDCDMPLVFLNACGATAVDPRQLGSFVQFFLLNRNRGLIGPQIMIPDQFARAFVEMFYSALVFQELPVGVAVLQARRKLAERKKNMLGLLYMHYGPSELCLAA